MLVFYELDKSLHLPYLLGALGAHESPEATTSSTSTFPAPIVTQVECVDDTRANSDIVAQLISNFDQSSLASSGVEVHELGVQDGVVGPSELVSIDGSSSILIASGSICCRDDGAVVDDEVAPDLLEGISEVIVGDGSSNGEVGRKISAVVRGCDRVLILPCLSRSNAEGFGKPLSWADEGVLGSNVKDSLLDASSVAGLGESGRALVAESVVTNTIVTLLGAIDTIKGLEESRINHIEVGEGIGDEVIVLSLGLDNGVSEGNAFIGIVLSHFRISKSGQKGHVPG